MTFAFPNNYFMGFDGNQDTNDKRKVTRDKHNIRSNCNKNIQKSKEVARDANKFMSKIIECVMRHPMSHQSWNLSAWYLHCSLFEQIKRVRMEELPDKKMSSTGARLGESMMSMDSTTRLLHNSQSQSFFDQTIIHWATLQVRSINYQKIWWAVHTELY